MSSELHEQLARAKADYRSIKYDGDLAAELGIDRPFRLAAWWALPLAAGAIAAMVALVVTHHAPSASSSRPAIVQKITPATSPVSPRLLAITDIHYEIYVKHVDSGVREAVHSLSHTADRALSAPLVTDSVQKVDEMKDGLLQIAENTWSQVRAGPKSGC